MIISKVLEEERTRKTELVCHQNTPAQGARERGWGKPLTPRGAIL